MHALENSVYLALQKFSLLSYNIIIEECPCDVAASTGAAVMVVANEPCLGKYFNSYGR